MNNHILVFRGVGKNDIYTSYDLLKSYLEYKDTVCVYNPNDYDNSDLQYNIDNASENIPMYFTGMRNWKEYTTLCCWNCSLTIKHVPAFLPINCYLDSHDDVYFHIYGLYCSWNCVISMVDKKFERPRRSEALLNVQLAYQKVHDVLLTRPIQRAPPFHKLQKYCGGSGISEEEFREHTPDIIKK